MDARLIDIIAQEVPAFVTLIKDEFVTAHPDVPPPTSADILAIFDKDFAASLAIDDALLDEPPDPPAA